MTICLEDEIDISRGDMIVPALLTPHVARRFRSSIVWMNAKPLEPGRSYFIKHTSHQVRAVIRSIHHRLDVNTLAHVGFDQGAERLELNEIGEISVETHRPLFFDPYSENRITGAFIVIDPLSNETLGAGMIIGIEGKEETRGQVTVTAAAERVTRSGNRPAVIAVEDSEAALLLERELFDRVGRWWSSQYGSDEGVLVPGPCRRTDCDCDWRAAAKRNRRPPPGDSRSCRNPRAPRHPDRPRRTIAGRRGDLIR